jgi:HAD superfamily hydrolase (TIGR01509 family)
VQKFKGLLMDMDGVLVDSMPLHFEAWKLLVQRFKIGISMADLRELIDARRNVEIFPILLGRPLPDAELHRLVDEKEALYHAQAEAKLPEVAGARAFCEQAQAQGIPMALATAASELNVLRVMDKMGFRKFFKVLVTARDVQRGKPDPEVYLKAATGLGLRPSECLVVEDSLPGVQAAKASGAACLALTTSHSEVKLVRAGADWTAPDLVALPSGLAQWVGLPERG